MRYALRRAGQAAIVLIAAFTATFFLLQLLPGDAILIKFDNPELGLTPEQIEAIRASYGADVPWWEQYLGDPRPATRRATSGTRRSTAPVCSSSSARRCPPTAALADARVPRSPP